MLDLSGVDEEISAPDSASLSITGDFTAAIRVNFNSLPSDADMVFFNKFLSAGNQRSYRLFIRDTAGTKTIRLTISTDGIANSAASLGITLSTGVDTVLKWQYDASAGQFEAFKNNVSLGTAAGLVTSIFDSTAVFYFGSDGVSGRHLDAVTTEAALWSTLLTQTERDLYVDSNVKGMPLQIQPGSLELYMPMDDVANGASATGATIRDLSGNINNGTGAGTTITGAAENILSYPYDASYVPFQAAIAAGIVPFRRRIEGY